MRVLVTGATGQVGRAVLRTLVAEGVDVVAAVREPTEGLTVPQVALDFEDPTTFDDALACGADRLFLLRPPPIADVRPTLNAFVDRRRWAQVVFLSVAGASRVPIIPHAKVEAHLRETGVPHTFVRPGFFAQNVLSRYLADLAEDDRLYVPAGGGRVAWVDTEEVGEAAARAFLDPDALGAAWELTGPEVADFDAVAAILTEILDRPIRYERASILGYRRHLLRRRGVPTDAATVFTVLHTLLRFGSAATVDPTLARVIGRRPATVGEVLWREADRIRAAAGR